MKKLLMKKLLLVLILFAFGCAGLQYKVYKLEDSINTGDKVDKILESENGVHAKRYGVRYNSGSDKYIGLYNIVIGDLKGLDKIYRSHKDRGFKGILVFPIKHSNNWKIAKYRYPKYRTELFENRKLSEKIVQKKNLPNPLNIMPNYLFKLVENAVMYEDGKYKVIFIIPETRLDDVEKLFGFVVKYGGIK